MTIIRILVAAPNQDAADAVVRDAVVHDMWTDRDTFREEEMPAWFAEGAAIAFAVRVELLSFTLTELGTREIQADMDARARTLRAALAGNRSIFVVARAEASTMYEWGFRAPTREPLDELLRAYTAEGLQVHEAPKPWDLELDDDDEDEKGGWYCSVLGDAERDRWNETRHDRLMQIGDRLGCDNWYGESTFVLPEGVDLEEFARSLQP